MGHKTPSSPKMIRIIQLHLFYCEVIKLATECINLISNGPPFVFVLSPVHSIYSALSSDHRHRPRVLWRKLQTPSHKLRSASLSTAGLSHHPATLFSFIDRTPLHSSSAPHCAPFDVVCLDCRCSFILWNLEC